MSSSTDRIEKKVLLKAPRSRVWRALANAQQFGEWFRADLKGKAFIAGERVKGHMTYRGYEHLMCDVVVEQVEPERLLSMRWHPAAVDPAADYSREPMTLIVFQLEDAAGGTLLTVVESGFDSIPLARR